MERLDRAIPAERGGRPGRSTDRRSVNIVEYDDAVGWVSRTRALDDVFVADLDRQETPAGVERAGPSHSSPDEGAPERGDRPLPTSVDDALDEALVHAPRRAGASYPEIIARIHERVGVDEEMAWAILGRALARSRLARRAESSSL